MPPDQDIRWIQRLQSLQKAYAQLRSAVDLAHSRSLSELEQQGLIQAFEFTHELAWKTLKGFLEFQGIQGLYGSKDTSRKAFSEGLIEDGEVWMEMISSRNQTSHTYNEATASEIVNAIISRYDTAFGQCIHRLLELEKGAS